MYASFHISLLLTCVYLSKPICFTNEAQINCMAFSQGTLQPKKKQLNLTNQEMAAFVFNLTTKDYSKLHNPVI